MFVNEFESSNSYRLQQIMSTLKNVHGVKLDLDSQSDSQVKALGESCEIVKNSIVKESAFNTWMQNPEYTKNMLIVEAVKIFLAEIAPKRMGKKSRKIKESTSPDAMVQMAELGRKMMDYAQAQRPDRGDEREMRILNAISQVGDKLTQLGTPFGPRELTDMDKKVIVVAKRRMGAGTVMERDSADQMAQLGRKMMDYAQAQRPDRNDDGELRILNAISQVGDKLTQLGTAFGPRELTDMDKKVIAIAKRRMGSTMEENTVMPTTPTAPGVAPAAKPKPGMVNVVKGTDKKTVPAAQLASLQSQGYSIVGDDETNESDLSEGPRGLGSNSRDWALNKMSRDPKHLSPKSMPPIGSVPKEKARNELKDLMAQYLGAGGQIKKVAEDDMEEGNEFSGALAAAKAQGKIEFEVGGKTYKVSEAEAMMESATQTMNEAAHMENHDYQASMARSELYRNTKYAMDMMKMISPTDDIKPWIAANLTKAATALDKMYHYMDYYHTFEPSELPTGGAATPVMAVSEDDDDLGESTGSIARQNLMMIMEYSTKLFRMIQPGDKLEGWVAMKLTNASEAISSSKHHMEYAQFEKHSGEMADDEMSQMGELSVRESKGKKSIKEGQMVTIGNLLMNSMINEDQDLQQAQTLLAAKSMSDDLQTMAEKLAKMSVEDLMPLVDTMKEQFGQEIANGFNDTMKAAIDAVLNAATEAKETADNSILSMQQGQVPGAGATDIEAAGAPAAAPEMGDEEGSEGADEFGATAAAAGPAEEPLGRAKKAAAGEEAPASLAEGKKPMSAAQEEFFGPKGDKKPVAKGDKKGEKPVAKDDDKAPKKGEKKGNPFAKKVNESLGNYKSSSFGANMSRLAHFDSKLGALAKKIEAAIDAEPTLQDDEKAALANILSHLAGFSDDIRSWEGQDPEDKMTNAINAVAHALDPRNQSAKPILNAMKKLAHGIAFKHEDDMAESAPMMEAKKPMSAKAVKEKKDVKESKVEEKAPPGKEAEDFIRNNKDGFKKLYGDRWEEVLYRTAWKKFGPKSENVIKTAKMLEAAKANKAKLVKAFESHKKSYAKMVNEGITSDVLRTGYGLEGQTMLDQITDVDGMIGRLKEMLRSEMKAGVHDIIMSEENNRKIASLAESKSQAPWGVVWKDKSKKLQQKFFESEDLRKYWIGLNKASLIESKLVNPADFDKRIGSLKSRKG